MKVHFVNTTRQRLTEAQFFPTIQRILKKYGIPDNVEVELQFVGKQRMRKLNQSFRQKDYATDVLSFPIWSNLTTIKAQSGPINLGSVVVCLPVAQQEAKENNEKPEKRINFLIEHSLLHLMGFHHEGDN